MKILNRLKQTKLWGIISPTLKNFSRINGTQWAGAFAFDVFFALFPLVILLVTIASAFIDRERAVTEIMANIQKFIPLSEKMQNTIFSTITGIINTRGQTGLIALVLLLWSALQGIITLVYAVNRAWKAEECSWWRMPIKSIFILLSTATMVILSKWAAVVIRGGRGLLSKLIHIPPWLYTLVSHLIPFLILFFGLSLFYVFAPCRPTKFAKIWKAILIITILLQAAEGLFVIYLTNFSNFNALYGTLGGFMALLMWIYLSGIIFIFGACLCVTMFQRGSSTEKYVLEEKKEKRIKK